MDYDVLTSLNQSTLVEAILDLLPMSPWTTFLRSKFFFGNS